MKVEISGIEKAEKVNDLEQPCPHCSELLSFVGLPRWNVNVDCPSCNMPILVEFDFYYDGLEEEDFYKLKKN